MKVIYTILIMILILFVITFSLENTLPMKLKYYDFFNIEWPTYMLLFVACLIGVVFMGCLGVVERFRLSRTIAHLNKTIRDLRRETRNIGEPKTEDDQKSEEPF
ncbi:MAG: LapA family protein [Syntrophaceae bacterium]|nr:LapA family protein [Syntrophaceae bacterium]